MTKSPTGGLGASGCHIPGGFTSPTATQKLLRSQIARSSAEASNPPGLKGAASTLGPCFFSVQTPTLQQREAAPQARLL